MPSKKLQSKYRTPSTTSVSSGSLLEQTSVEYTAADYTMKDQPMVGEHHIPQYQQRRRESKGRQIWLYVLSAAMAIGLLVTTSLYASESEFSGGMRFVYSSSSRTIFVLSVLSGLTGLLITATIEGSIERLQWLLIVRGDGLNLAKFLSLHAGTGPMGLLSLLFGRGFPFLSSTRVWSMFRLVSMILVPVLGILIMSNVNTRMSFHPIRDGQHVMGWGMSPFNGSLGQNVSIITDQLINAVMFLSDPTRSVDDTPGPLAAIPCANGPQKRVDTRCKRAYYLPAGVEHVAAQLDGNPRAAKSDVFLAMEQQGYFLEYEEGERDWTFDQSSECISYGFAFSAFRLCMRNTKSNALEARILHCPSSLCGTLSCLSNKQWHSNPGWQMRLTASFRNANVAYSRANGTVLSHDFSDAQPTPAQTPAREMLTALRDALGDFTNMNMTSLTAILVNPDQMKLFPFYVYPAYVWGHLNSAATLASQDPAQVYRGAETLQSLLATILYFCQPSLYSRALQTANITSSTSSTDPTQIALARFAASLSDVAPPNTPVYLAEMRYQIVVGRATLTAYLAICASTLLVCVCILFVSIAVSHAKKIPATTSFPMWDAYTNCEVDDAGLAAHQQQFGEPQRLTGREMIRAMTKMRIKIVDEDQRYRGPG